MKCENHIVNLIFTFIIHVQHLGSPVWKSLFEALLTIRKLIVGYILHIELFWLILGS